MATRETAAFVPIEDVVKEYIDLKMGTMAEFRRLYSIAYRGMEELGIDIWFSPKTVKLDVNENRTVDLPSDYIKYTKIGVLTPEGYVATLRRNTSLTGFDIDGTDRLSVNTDQGSEQVRLRDFIFVNFFDGNAFVNLYGIGAALQNKGEFDINEDEGLIYLDNNFTYQYVILEYIAAPMDDEIYKVPMQVREALLAYIAWKDIEFLGASRKVNLSEKQIRRKEYYNQRRLAKARVQPFLSWEANEIIRFGQKSALKG